MHASEMHPTLRPPFRSSWGMRRKAPALKMEVIWMRATSCRSYEFFWAIVCVVTPLQMLNIEIFKAPRVGEIDNYELLVLDVAAMKVPSPPNPLFVAACERGWCILSCRWYPICSSMTSGVCAGVHSTRVFRASIRFFLWGGKEGIFAGSVPQFCPWAILQPSYL